MGKKNRKRSSAPAQPEPVTTILEPGLFRAVELLARDALAYSANHQGVRSAVAAFIQYLRLRALADPGHITPDIIALEQVLKHASRKFDPNSLHERPPPEPDPIELLANPGSRRKPRLNDLQVSAANAIREIWVAFGRLWAVKSSAYYRAGKGSRRVDPVQIMGHAVLNLFNGPYKQWYVKAQRRQVPRMTSGCVSAVSVVFDIVNERRQPRVVDAAMRLPRGTALRVLQKELSAFNDPTLAVDHAANHRRSTSGEGSSTDNGGEGSGPDGPPDHPEQG